MADRRYTARELGEAVLQAANLSYDTDATEVVGRKLGAALGLPVVPELPAYVHIGPLTGASGIYDPMNRALATCDPHPAWASSAPLAERLAFLEAAVRRYNAVGEALEYIGTETIEGTTLHHLRHILREGGR